MKNAQVIKSSASVATAEDLMKINTYTRRDFTEEEIYVFSVVLCDNEVDRDFERFTVEALFEMEKLFVGKTGICDHNPKAQNQRARIFECFVEAPQGRKTSLGDDYFRLVARAYMPKTEENKALINNIESGITKEVSVGLSAKKSVCSVCSKERAKGCFHTAGETYDEGLCYFELSDIADAYEWSFVAVPAQREAGIIKSHTKNVGKDKDYMKGILKSLSKGEDVTFGKDECKALENYIRRLEKRAQQGDEYVLGLRKEFLRLSAAAEPEISEKTMSSVANSLDTKELKEFCEVYRKKAEKTFGTGALQTRKNPEKTHQDNKEYSI